MNDNQLNDYIAALLNASKEKRAASNGQWAMNFDGAMAMWEHRHPGTRPPALKNIGKPPPCFTGKLPPIYEGDL